MSEQPTEREFLEGLRYEDKFPEPEAPAIPVGSEARCREALAMIASEVPWVKLTDVREYARVVLDAEGTGQERVIPATDLRAFIEAERRIGWGDHLAAREESLRRLAERFGLDEYTPEAPSGGSPS